MKVLELFAGIGGFGMGLERAGMEIVAQVEIDPQCRRVLAHHWPDVARYEDVTGFGAASLSVMPDLVCAGFPCQDVSVAGKRAGLAGARTGLFFEIIRIVKEIQLATNNEYPGFIVLENVPGLLSSNGGRDFAVVLESLADAGALDIAWRVLDSRWFGVAQRRRRVFLVADFAGQRAAEILFEPESCSGHLAAGRTAGEGVAAPIGGGSGSRGWRDDLDHSTYIPDVVPQAMSSKWSKGSSGPALAVRTAQTGANGIGVQEDQAYTLDGTQQAVAHSLRAEGFDASEDGTGRGTPLVAQVQWASGGGKVENPTAQALRSGAEHNYQFARVGAAVRRLTPTECERLQGFPDGHTDVDGMADGPRYRMLGNAVTVPVIEWIGRRMLEVA